jgi:uncharacterized membrane protein YphA (DoxX/SURF4 family)
MKIAFLIARLLLGLVFVVFGLNGFVPFLPAPALDGPAAQFFGALYVSHFLVVIFAIQLLGGILLLVNRYVPLALTFLGPVIVNIVCYHAFMAPSGLPLALLVTLLWFAVFYQHRSAFAGLFEPTGTDQVAIPPRERGQAAH